MINLVPNFLEQDVIDSITKKFEDSRGKAAFEVNDMGRWGKGLEAGSYAPVFILPLDEYKDFFKKKYAEQVHPMFGNYENLTCFLHIWPKGSQINWHHDDDEKDPIPRLSSTIYINPSWNWNWGGFFIYDDKDEGQKWIFPHYNLMTWFVPPIWHSTSMVTLLAEQPRLSIQLFFSR